MHGTILYFASCYNTRPDPASCYWKQWRLCRTKIGHLLALGVNLRTAIIAGVSSKSYWRLSRTKATQVGMPNEWLKAQGLVSIRELWMKAQGYA
jgi:RNA-directed DNA polymerase